MTLAELEGIVNNQTVIEFYVNNSQHSLWLMEGQSLPDFLGDYEVTDIYASEDHLIICLESEKN